MPKPKTADYTAGMPKPFAWVFEPRVAWMGFGIGIAVLCGLFYRPLSALINFARGSELYSYVLLMPFVSVYLVMSKKSGVRVGGDGKSAGIASALLISGLLFWQLPRFGGAQPSLQNSLFIAISSFVLTVIGCAVFFLGTEFVKTNLLPIGLLFFLAPLPSALESGIETFFQHTSADAAHGLFVLARTTLYREGLALNLPGITLEVARECSGIRSSLILFISSLIAGYLFLSNPWKRLILTVFVIPLGIVRNGFRIFTIGQLCVYVSPSMVDSWVHRKGGPLFFVLSLIPFFGLLVYLARTESRRKKAPPSSSQ